jgi:FkbM family methyltransferase
MIKRALGSAVERLPKSFRDAIRDRYWRIKSKLLYQRLFEILDLEYQLRSGITVRVASQGEWWTYNDIFVNHEYDAAIETALSSRALDQPFVVLDLGANIGYFLLRVLDLISQNQEPPFRCDVTLVEGSPSNFKTLQDRLAAQQLDHIDYRLVHGLVGARSGQGVINESALHVKNTIMQGPARRGTPVEFVDLCKVMAGRENVDLLKCDIEGAEQSFIENYPDLLRRVNTAVFELHHGMCETARCLRMLSDLGFRQTDLRSNDEVSICLFARNH